MHLARLCVKIWVKLVTKDLVKLTKVLSKSTKKSEIFKQLKRKKKLQKFRLKLKRLAVIMLQIGEKVTLKRNLKNRSLTLRLLEPK